MITAMKLSRENETRGNMYGGFQKGSSSPSGTSRGRPRRRSSLKPRTGGLDGRRSRRQSHRVSFANSIEVKEFGNSSNENTPTQGNVPAPAATLQVSTPIENKLKRPRLAEEKSGISRLSIIPKCDTNFIDDSDDFEPYVDSSPSQNVINTRSSNRVSIRQNAPQQSAPQLSMPGDRGANEQSAAKICSSQAHVSMAVRQEEVESEGRDVSVTRYNNSDMELTLEDGSRGSVLDEVPAKDVSVTHYNNSDMELTNVDENCLPLTKDERPPSIPAGSINPPDQSVSTVVEKEAVEDVTVTHYNNSEMDLTDVAENRSLHQAVDEHPPSILADSVNPLASVSTTIEEDKVGNVTVTHYNNSDMDLTMEELSQVATEVGGASASLQKRNELSTTITSLVSALVQEDDVGKEPMKEFSVTCSYANNSDMEVTTGEDVSLMSVAGYRDKFKDSVKNTTVTQYNNSDMEVTSVVPEMKDESPPIPAGSINPPVSLSTTADNSVRDVTITHSNNDPRSVAENREISHSEEKCPPSIPESSFSSRASVLQKAEDPVENTLVSHRDNNHKEVTLPKTLQAQEVKLPTDAPVRTIEDATGTPVSTSGVLEKESTLPIQSSATSEGPGKVVTPTSPSSKPHFSKTSIPNEIAELEKLPGTGKSQPNMALLKKKRKSPRLVHVPRTMVTRSNATSTQANDTFFNHVEYLRSRFLSIASSCFERLKNPTYVMGHPDFKEFLEVVINRANMGQSLLTVLINYGKVVRLSGEVSPVPVASEPINENGPLESFEWIKKMIFEVQQKWPDVEAALVSAADLYHWQVDLWSNSKIQVTIYNSARITFIIDGGHLNSFPQRIVDIKVSYGRGSLMSSVPPVKSYSFTSEIAQLIWTVIKQKQ